jgi:hypothetical protein
MNAAGTAHACWSDLTSSKDGLMRRVERYASLTIPKICLPEGFDLITTDQTHDYQSAGAQAVNHLTNKIMLALFRPSAPFFRVQVDQTMKAELQAAKMDEAALAPALAQMERDASRELDARAQRPKLYQVIKHLIVAGNVLLCLHKDGMRVMGLRYFCVKRDQLGRVIKLVIMEHIKFDELEKDAQAILAGQHSPDTKVNHYKLITRNDAGDYEMRQSVNTTDLGPKFQSKWPEDKLPYRVLAWDLADEADYGTGLVEEYAGDLEALSVLSEAVVDGAILGCEYRWMIKGTGATSAKDFSESSNGDALPGDPDDVAAVQGGNPQAITVAQSVLEKYERRIAGGFLMFSAVTRNAERVTAEEVRLTANELETAYGGVYSGLGNTLQGPVAHWLLDANGTSINGTHFKIIVITGLDALSRNSDLENLRLALQDMAEIEQLPEGFKLRVNWNAVADYVGQGRGIDLRKFLLSDEQVQAKIEQAQQARVQEASATAAGQAVAKGESTQ